MKIISIFLISLFTLVPFGFSKAKEVHPVSGTTGSVGQVIDKVQAEVVDAITEELTGNKTTVTKTVSSSAKPLPPGLAKQGKVPPGHSKGKVTVEVEKEDSLIQKFVKGLFSGKKDE